MRGREGHLDNTEGLSIHAHVRALADAIVAHAQRLQAPFIVLKEFPAKYRPALDCFRGRTMPDKVRFFVWRLKGRIVGFAACMLHGDAFYAEYIGLDYTVALDLHLYHCAYRDMMSWAIGHGFKEFRSSGLNYDPKLHFRHSLDPIDLYIRHTSTTVNCAMKLLLPGLEPTRNDKTLRKFANYNELWGV